MTLPIVEDDSISLWFFGPGTGELVLVRAPIEGRASGAWLVIDGCSVDGLGCAQRVLDFYEATPSLVVMTHPHADHASGLAEVVDRATKGQPNTWPKLGLVPAPQLESGAETWNADQAIHVGNVEQVVSAILNRWQENPACQWNLDAGSIERLGEASVHALSPTAKERDRALSAFHDDKLFKTYNWNRAATAFLISWKSRRILLGSDLDERSGQGWTNAHAHDKELGAHDVHKVAHHGSEGALGEQLKKPKAPRLRTWICTPFAKSGLPKAADGRGLSHLLQIEDEILITGLSRPHADQAGSRTISMSREELRDDPNRQFSPKTTGFPDCWIHVRIPAKGLVLVTRGPGSIRVTK